MTSYLGDYEIVRRIASGGMADVYLARPRTGGGALAVKVLANDRVAGAAARAMFRDEARLGTLLGHRNVAAVYEHAMAGSVEYLAMEFVDGIDVGQLLHATRRAERTLPYDAAIAIVMAAAAGLEHAHTAYDANGEPLGVVHRDVSPSNIMVTRHGDVKLIDFGIALASGTRHARADLVCGKPSYMSPEQCFGDRVDQRSDVFSVGVVLYELATGKRCFEGHCDRAVMEAVVAGRYTRPSDVRADLPAALEAVIVRALAVDPDERYASATELIVALVDVALCYGWRPSTAAIAAAMRAVADHAPADDLSPTDDRVTAPANRRARGSAACTVAV